MVKSIFLTLFIFVFSCNSVKTEYLGNSKLKIPEDNNFFTKKYRQKYNVKTPKDIDSSSVYIEIYHIDFEGNIFNYTYDYKKLYKFYPNGCVNLFSFKDTQKIKEINFSPKLRGYRGVTYKKDNKQIISFVVPVTEYLRYGTKDYQMKVKGDTIFISTNNSNITDVLIKTKLPKENLNYKATW